MTDSVDTQRTEEIVKVANKALRKFGLTDNEIAVYVQTLIHGELSPFTAAKLTDIPRTTVYDVFMTLSLKGLIDLEHNSGFEKQQTRVRAKNPSIMRKILEERRRETYDIETDLSLVLPLLKREYHKEDSNALIEFLPGIEGMKRVYLELEGVEQSSQKDAISWTNLMPLDMLGGKIVNNDVRQGSLNRVKKQIRTKYLVPLNNWTKHVMTYQSSIDPDYLKTRDFRFIESPIFECYLEMVIANNVFKAACAEGEEVWGLIIKSKALVATLRSIFISQWQNAQPITPDLVKSWGKNAFLQEQRRKKQQ
ncbi:hypothetical protein IT418_01410 [bacterium]|nr:hypothetical protein [bacterium]